MGLPPLLLAKEFKRGVKSTSKTLLLLLLLPAEGAAEGAVEAIREGLVPLGTR